MGTLRKRQLPSRAELTSISLAKAERPPHNWIALSSGFMKIILHDLCISIKHFV